MQKLEELDKRFLWHPFTPQSEWARDLFRYPMVISRGKGIYLYDTKGNRYIDGVSSLWANLHGHRHPKLDKALTAQIQKVAHSTFLGLTHEPGIRLAKHLVSLLPKGLSRIFYSDNGSTAVEVALKMSYQFHTQRFARGKEKRTQFLSLHGAYHGDTLGSVSVGGISLFHKKYRPLLFQTRFAMSPHCLRCPFRKVDSPQLRFQNYRYDGEKPKPGDFRPATGCRWECLADVENTLKNHGCKISAAILEPVVQGASGMLVMPAGYLWGFSSLCKKYGVPMIADEVAVGFGRTGKMFACEQEGVRPDFLCMAKGITGGYLPLAATASTEKVYQSFLGGYEEFKTFFHGHTYTANPLACSVAQANLRIFQEENVLRKVRQTESLFENLLKEILPLKNVGGIRRAGLMAGIELVQDVRTLKPFPPSARIGKRVCLEARKWGVLLRPLGDVIVLMPPLSIRKSELTQLVQNTKQAIQSLQPAVIPATPPSFPRKRESSTDFPPTRFPLSRE
ncbi:MAG: adenosylmethionine--8-amino-7-oxononanoate transaminase [Elusimicrobia bacterium]|nr:adenosylmethionine--8-amino-7-oxononanoate transaminase [Elusimicrobiota bacterium]